MEVHTVAARSGEESSEALLTLHDSSTATTSKRPLRLAIVSAVSPSFIKGEEGARERQRDRGWGGEVL